MRKIVYAILICVSSGLGGLFFGHGPGDDRALDSPRRHLEVIHGQLVGLKELLQDFRKAHGRYPTNDEGLPVLDNFDLRFRARMGPTRLAGPGDSRDGWIGWGMFWLMDNKSHIHGLRRLHHIPSEEDMLGWARFTRDWNGAQSENPVVEVGIGKSDDLYILSPAGVVSPWLIPYVYENRRGCDAKAFADSPADKDTRRRYSVQVDEGVYVSCVGGESVAADYDRRWRNWICWKILGGSLMAGAFAPLVLLVRGSLRKTAAGVVGGFLLLFSGLSTGVFVQVTCYAMLPPFSRRSPVMVSRRAELLEKHRAAGVINADTYEKTMAVLEHGPATRPASQPAK